jgi:anti-sigma factor RsiW
MTCAELEILLCDYVDGTLHAEQRTALESHLPGCANCTQLARDVQGVTAFIKGVPQIDPPAELMTRILHNAPAGRRSAAEGRDSSSPSWTKRLFGGFVHSVLQPRYVMGMAMTILSFSMLARFAHIEPRQLRAADLDPVKVWQGIDDRSHRVWDRTMKYYDNLKLVIEIQSRLQEWTDQDPGAASGAGARNRGSQQ